MTTANGSDADDVLNEKRTTKTNGACNDEIIIMEKMRRMGVMNATTTLLMDGSNGRPGRSY